MSEVEEVGRHGMFPGEETRKPAHFAELALGNEYQGWS